MTQKSRDIKITEAFTFDDVLLKPLKSDILPSQVDTSTDLTKNISLKIPLISSAMDTVTESSMAITMAQNGGIGCIHKNLSISQQKEEVLKVKKYESGIVNNPKTLHPRQTVLHAKQIMMQFGISGIPIIADNKKLVGIITNRDIRFASDMSIPVEELMTRDLITVKSNITQEEARLLFHKHRIERLIMVNDDYECIGLITVKDIEKAKKHPNATKDLQGRLRTAAAIGASGDYVERAQELIDAGVDALVVDTAHGHSTGVINAVAKIKKIHGDNIDVIGGNIATSEAAKELIDAGVDAVKVGIGPGSICTTRIVAGIGVPQLSAVMDVAEVCYNTNIKLIADGGIRFSGDLAKAIAAGANCIMIGSLLAGTEESPGDVVLFKGRSYKNYRGMGSVGAMATGSADRYFQAEVNDDAKLVPEGVEGRVPFKGLATSVIYQLVGGLRSSMGYTGSSNISQMQDNCEFIKITNSALKESHAHDIAIVTEAPNYHHSD
ncbi:MAG: IMP dehydrogenase [Pseudomonadota bacterium]